MSAVLTEPSAGPVVTREQVQKAPKVLLHDHLDGGLRPATIVESDVTYTRKDGATVTVPIVTIYHERDDGKIDDYRVYGDVAPVFA